MTLPEMSLFSVSFNILCSWLRLWVRWVVIRASVYECALGEADRCLDRVLLCLGFSCVCQGLCH